MLKSLSVRNVVLIDKLDLDFSEGLSVFSGETGAGKSILLDSLGLVLGKRGETGLIRHGTDKLTVSAVFEINDKDNPFYKICAQNDIEVEDEIIVKRSLSTDGKSKIFLNDQPITQRLLKELGSYLVEIHGQFDNQGLLNPVNHLSVLDSFGGYEQELNCVSESYKKYKKLQKELIAAQDDYAKSVSDEQNLIHWIDELEKLNVKVGEAEELSKKRVEVMNAEKIIENLNVAYSCLQGKDIASMLQKAQSALSRANHLTENKFSDIEEMLNTTLIEFNETVNLIEQKSSEITHNSDEAEAIEERLFALKSLARKHSCDIDDLPSILDDFRAKVNLINKGQEHILRLNKELCLAKQDYINKADIVRSLRRKAAQNLDSAVKSELPYLKMEKANFITAIDNLPESSWSEKGMDDVSFKISTNVNTDYGDLSKIASGGELSRFMLALKVNLAKKSSVETLIFDEIDAGIGGATAQAVGERLKKLSDMVQVLVVTHSPQVASFSKTHFMVSKSSQNDETTTSVCLLNENQKQEEIARMLSGDTITDEARAAAKALICG